MNRRNRLSRKSLIAGQLAVAGLVLTEIFQVPTRIVWNATASVPIGLYSVSSIAQPKLGQLVLVRPPAMLASFLAERRYIGPGTPLLKTIAALPGQMVCRHGLVISVDDSTIGEARERDRLSRQLPQWSGCRVLRNDQVFLMNSAAQDSMDGRYFGPLPSVTIVGQATPIWTRT